MKFLYSILFFALPFLSMAQEKASIGMSLAQVKHIYPNAQVDSNENGITLSRPDTCYQLDGTWGYRFKEDKLMWIFFHRSFKEINGTNFQKCLSSTRQLIKDFTHFYGKADTALPGDTTFIDPVKHRHWGYNVLEARWKNFNGMKIKIQFDFLGGKGDYAFLVIINYFDKDYPYYD